MIQSRGDATMSAVRSGLDILRDPLRNKGTAFSEHERDKWGLHGLLPPVIASLDEQVARRLQAYRNFPNDFDRYVFLRGLQDSNEILFYALLSRHLEEMLPVVYTPTVGLGCQSFSEHFWKPRGIFLSYPHKDRMVEILSSPRFDDVEVIVVTDGERVLGLGDQGAGGMGISIGKLALYTACGGINPAKTLPLFLDVGTDNPERLADPLYVGWRHERVRGEEYDAFIEAFVEAVRQRWPNALLQWEDFARHNATRLLDKYRDRLCTFNDDVQGTAVVAAGTLLATGNVTGIPIKDQKIVVLGAGGAGCGISALLLRAMIEDGLSEAEARSRFYLVDRNGLLVEGMPELLPFQEPFVQPRDVAGQWQLDRAGFVGLADVVRNVRPTTLIGVSGQPGGFPEQVVRDMASGVERPVIFPLSNPNSRAEATPADILAWTDGRAVVGVGSPFPPAPVGDRLKRIDQTNNSYVFPGIGLGAMSVKARRISDGMLMAAARALASVSPTSSDKDGNLLPPVNELRQVSLRVAEAVARQAIAEGLASATTDDLNLTIENNMWHPGYASI
ncbi:malate dehydrogenase [Methylobacterium platani JCM 14648]|nr:malate dehydrogenase [Methylobacterium platani JCM 14648]